MTPILLSFATFISTFAGGLFAIKHRRDLHYIMSFTAGVLIAVCFFDILPEAFTITGEHNIPLTFLSVSVVVGFLLFHILEKTILIHHAHEEEYTEHKHPQIGLVGALGLSFHSFLDGVGIGLGFHVSPHVGFLVAIAVIAHDFSDGLNTVTLMLTHKNTQNKAKRLLFLDAVTPIAGVLSTYAFSIPQNVLVLYLGFFAGFLLYIGASDLLPEAHSKHSSFKMIGLTLLGVIFIFLVTRFT
ncbi:MAG TPA: ZIP family metal transporter [Candidatus Saccharimonadales bacterium]|nr:ZIP family metal transporter [Candidatus Saccharimonadales bacterium]